jgi:energy-coupling factor transporter ATP-binding protein EcfA2
VVSARAVTKWFGETTALDEVDLLVDPGVVHGLLGPNGAGKTTLLSALFVLVLPDERTLRLFGRTRAQAGPGWLNGVGGFVETPRFYPYLTARQNLAILAGLDGGDAASIIDQAIESAGLAGAPRRKVRGYSPVMRQRLGGCGWAGVSSGHVRLRSDGPAQAGWGGPDQGARLGLLQTPGGRALHAVIVAASARNVAGTGKTALIVGDGVVEITPRRWPAADREPAVLVTYLDQVPHPVGDPVSGG